MVSPTCNDLYGLWGTSGSNIFAVGRDGVILNYDGSFWRYMPVLTSKWLEDVWGSSSSSAFIVGFDGLIYTQVYTYVYDLCPDCSGVTVNPDNVTFKSGANCECVATTAINIGANVTIESGAIVTFKAPLVNVTRAFMLKMVLQSI